MQPKLTMQQWLTVIRKCLPPRGILYAGAGSGTQAVAFCHQMEAARALFVEADENLAARLAATVLGNEAWQALAVLLADADDEQEFHLASSQNESGMIEPERLTGLWRNLRRRESRRMQAITIDHLWESVGLPADSFNWAVIDCLPAARILSGGQESLTSWDVVIARVVIDGSLLPASGVTKDEVDALLAGKGYQLLAIEPERHPAVGLALYVRDWKIVLESQLSRQAGQLAHLVQVRDEHATLAAQRLAQVDALTQATEEFQKQQSAMAARQGELEQEVQALTAARNEQATLAAQRLAQVDALTQASEEFQKQLSARTARHGELEKEVQALTAARNEKATLATERLAQVDALTQASEEFQKQLSAVTARHGELEKQVQALTVARNEQGTLAAERLTQMEALVRAKQALEQQKSVLTEQLGQLEKDVKALAQARDEQAKLATERQIQIASLQQQMESKRTSDAELSARQQLMHDELLRAEAQIDLIKDVLLREPGL